MGNDTINQAADGTPIPASNHNSIRGALSVDHVPRNSSGVVTDLAGNLGSTSYEWLKAFIASGYWNAGDIKPHHSYNGTVGPGHGWMLADGRLINETNYNTEHGAGSWATYIISSLLDGKYLPDLTGEKYLSGVSATTQAGTSPITTVGNASNQINIQHSHTIGTHNHQWYNYNTSGDHQSYNISGSVESITVGFTAQPSITTATGTNNSLTRDGYTNLSTPSCSNELSATQSIQPISVQVQYYVRII